MPNCENINCEKYRKMLAKGKIPQQGNCEQCVKATHRRVPGTALSLDAYAPPVTLPTRGTRLG